MKKKEIIIETIVFLYMVLFLYAAGSKLIDYNRFIGQIGKSPLLTDFAEWIAWIIPSIEIIIAVSLVIPRIRLAALYTAFGLMVMFTSYIVAILTISDKLPCSCGGVLSMFGWKEHLIFNIGFVFLAITAIILSNKKEYQNKAALV